METIIKLVFYIRCKISGAFPNKILDWNFKQKTKKYWRFYFHALDTCFERASSFKAAQVKGFPTFLV